MSLHSENEWEWGRREKNPDRVRDTHREMEKERIRVRPEKGKTLRGIEKHKNADPQREDGKSA